MFTLNYTYIVEIHDKTVVVNYNDKKSTSDPLVFETQRIMKIGHYQDYGGNNICSYLLYIGNDDYVYIGGSNIFSFKCDTLIEYLEGYSDGEACYDYCKTGEIVYLLSEKVQAKEKLVEEFQDPYMWLYSEGYEKNETTNMDIKKIETSSEVMDKWTSRWKRIV